VALQAQRRDVRIGFERGMGYMKCCATYLMCPQFEMGEVPGVCARFRDRGPPPPHRGRAIVSSAGRAITVSQWMYKDVKQPCRRQNMHSAVWAGVSRFGALAPPGAAAGRLRAAGATQHTGKDEWG
jgi:hypothetical protein